MKFKVELRRDIIETVTVVVPGDKAHDHISAGKFALYRAELGLGGWSSRQPEPTQALTITAVPEPQDLPPGHSEGHSEPCRGAMDPRGARDTETKGQDDTIPDWMLASIKRMRAAGCTVNITIAGKQKIPAPEPSLPEWLSSAIEDEAVPYVQALQQLRLFVETFAGEEWMLEAVRKRLWELMLRLELAEPKNS